MSTTIGHSIGTYVVGHGIPAASHPGQSERRDSSSRLRVHAEPAQWTQRQKCGELRRTNRVVRLRVSVAASGPAPKKSTLVEILIPRLQAEADAALEERRQFDARLRHLVCVDRNRRRAVDEQAVLVVPMTVARPGRCPARRRGSCWRSPSRCRCEIAFTELAIRKQTARVMMSGSGTNPSASDAVDGTSGSSCARAGNGQDKGARVATDQHFTHVVTCRMWANAPQIVELDRSAGLQSPPYCGASREGASAIGRAAASPPTCRRPS